MEEKNFHALVIIEIDCFKSCMVCVAMFVSISLLTVLLLSLNRLDKTYEKKNLTIASLVITERVIIKSWVIKTAQRVCVSISDCVKWKGI